MINSFHLLNVSHKAQPYQVFLYLIFGLTTMPAGFTYNFYMKR